MKGDVEFPVARLTTLVAQEGIQLFVVYISAEGALVRILPTRVAHPMIVVYDFTASRTV